MDVTFPGAVAAFAAYAALQKRFGRRCGLKPAGVALQAGRFDGAGHLQIGLVFVAGGDVPAVGDGVIRQGRLEELAGLAEEVAAADVAGAEEPLQLAGGAGDFQAVAGADVGMSELLLNAGATGAAGGLRHGGLGVRLGDGGMAGGADGVPGIGQQRKGRGQEQPRAHQGTRRNSAGVRARRVMRETRMAPLK